METSQHSLELDSDKRRHHRTSLDSHWSVLLIPKGRRPHACKVVNFNRSGILLAYGGSESASSLTATGALNAGDEVDVSFMGSAPTYRSHTLRANVVRVAHPEIALDFTDADPEAIEALQHQVAHHAGGAGTAPALRGQPPDAAEDEPEPEAETTVETTMAQHTRTPRREYGLSRTIVYLAIAVVVAIGLGLHLYGLQHRIATLEQNLAASQNRMPQIDTAAVAQRADAAASKAEQLSGAVDAASEQLSVLSSQLSAQQQQIEALAQRIAAAEQRPPSKAVEAVQAPATRWTVHLLSVSDRAAAESFAAQARAAGIEVEETAVTAGDRQLFRFSVGGFTSQQEAAAFADRVRDQLKLKDTPWIAKQ